MVLPENTVPNRGKYWVTLPDQERPIHMGTEGFAVRPAKTVVDVFNETTTKFAHKAGYHQKIDGKWNTITWSDFRKEALRAARSLLKLGLKRFGCTCIIGFNCPEWILADVGSILAGGVPAGIYTTNGPEACAYVVQHSESSIVFVENEKQLKKFLAVRDRLPELKYLIQWSGEVDPSLEGVLSWNDFIKLGDDDTEMEKLLEERMADQKPGQLCTLIYTSGTTDNPKAVMLSHDNMTWAAHVFVTSLGGTDKSVLCSFLPLSHGAAQHLDIHGPMSVGAEVWFARPDALKGTLGETLKEVRPTIFFAVPRVYEKIMEQMKHVAASNSWFKSKVSGWARGIGLNAGYRKQKNQSEPFGTGVANWLVFKPVREALGFDRCHFLGSGAAPITVETLEFFLSLGMPIYEIYGMSESSTPQTISVPDKFKTGSCGPVFPGAELKLAPIDVDPLDGAESATSSESWVDDPTKPSYPIADPDDQFTAEGELCYRGRHVFMGYLKDPISTMAAMDNSGWLHSGDIGRADSEGFIYITGRLKELVITAGGENIPPVPIEVFLKKNCERVVSNVMVVGDRRRFLTCLISLQTQVEGDGSPTRTLTRACRKALADLGAGEDIRTVDDVVENAVAMSYIQDGITKYNKEQSISHAQNVQKFRILPYDFSLPGGELTPTMKLKRRVVLQKYQEIIEEMYLPPISARPETAAPTATDKPTAATPAAPTATPAESEPTTGPSAAES